MKIVSLNRKTNPLSCLACESFPGDYEDTNNGSQVVYCEDGCIRCVDMDVGCAWFKEGE